MKSSRGDNSLGAPGPAQTISLGRAYGEYGQVTAGPTVPKSQGRAIS